MKYTVHVTVTMSVEIDSAELKNEFGKATKRLVLEEALSKATLNDAFDSKAVIFETYKDEVKAPRKGLGSY